MTSLKRTRSRMQNSSQIQCGQALPLPSTAYVDTSYEGFIKFYPCPVDLTKIRDEMIPQTQDARTTLNAHMNSSAVIRPQNVTIGTHGLATCGAVILRGLDNDGTLIAHAISHESLIFADQTNGLDSGTPTKACIGKSCKCKLSHLGKRINEFNAKYPNVTNLHTIVIGGAEYVSPDQNTYDNVQSYTLKKAEAEYVVLDSIVSKTIKTTAFKLVAYIPYINERYDEDDTRSVTIIVTKDSIKVFQEDRN